jgi:hypothetical protein
MATPSQLKKAVRDGRLVKFSRRFEDDIIRGYVLDVGPRFFMLLILSDRVWFDGFECFRTQDVRSFTTDPYRGFAEAVLKKRGERKPRAPKISVASIEDVLLTASRYFPLVTIHLERSDPEVCYIGRIIGIEGDQVSMLEIAPGAVWHKNPSKYRLSHITRVGFGGDYENALAIIGKEPPKKGNNRPMRASR